MWLSNNRGVENRYGLFFCKNYLGVNFFDKGSGWV